MKRVTTVDAHDRIAGSSPRDRSRRRRRDGGDRELAGRGQILDAAIASILELGFYRASSNEIARRALYLARELAHQAVVAA